VLSAETAALWNAKTKLGNQQNFQQKFPRSRVSGGWVEFGEKTPRWGKGQGFRRNRAAQPQMGFRAKYLGNYNKATEVENVGRM